jgi:hypothetical protein
MRSQTTVAVLGIVIAACGGASVGAPETTTTAVETTTTTEAPTTTLAPTTTTVAETTTTIGASPTTTILRGEPVDMGPSAGAVLGVIGVRHNDVLNLRARPGADQPIVGRIPPTYDNLVARGATRMLPASFWTKVRYQGIEGWVNMRYVAYLGSTNDVTFQVIEDLGERPEASTMAELGRMVAEWATSDDPPSDIVMVVNEEGGDLGEVTFDVVGLGDDAVRGVRLHVFAENLDGHFQLRTVEQTIFCDPARGVDEGTCV